MAVHRYWRLTAFALLDAGTLELSEAQAWAGATRVDMSATLSATVAPSAGAVADLKDGSAAAPVVWPLAAWSAPGFALVWDFGAGGEQDVTRLRLGAGGSAATFPRDLRLESSDDGSVWTVQADISRITYPGPAALTQDPATFVGQNLPTQWDATTAAPGVTIGNGGLTASGMIGARAARSLFGALSGKYYFELHIDAAGAQNAFVCGIGTASESLSSYAYTRYYYAYNGYPFGAAAIYTTGDVISYVLDMDDGTIRFWKNGTDLGVAFSGLSGVFYPIVSQGSSAGAPGAVTANFGGSAFVYTPPSGFIAGLGAFGYPVIPTDALQPVRWSTRVDRAMAWPGAARPAGAASAAPLPRTSFNDVNFGGWGRIYGTVAEKHTPANVPLRRRVLLLEERSQVVVRETWSDAVTGAYEFRGVREGVPFSVIAYDHEHNYRAVIADNLLADAWGVWGSA